MSSAASVLSFRLFCRCVDALIPPTHPECRLQMWPRHTRVPHTLLAFCTNTFQFCPRLLGLHNSFGKFPSLPVPFSFCAEQGKAEGRAAVLAVWGGDRPGMRLWAGPPEKIGIQRPLLPGTEAAGAGRQPRSGWCAQKHTALEEWGLGQNSSAVLLLPRGTDGGHRM